jgi:predicted DNA-binding transcriptional regulator AlpA
MTPLGQLVDFLQVPERFDQIAAGDVFDLLAELEMVRLRLLARLFGVLAASRDARESPHVRDRLLTAPDTAAVLRVTTRWLYRHHKSLPFTRRLSGRALRFSERGLHRWLELQRQRT